MTSSTSGLTSLLSRAHNKCNMATPRSVGGATTDASSIPRLRLDISRANYEVVRLAARALAWPCTPTRPTLAWIDGGREAYSEASVRKINHFYGMNSIGTKCNLAFTLNRAKAVLPLEFAFHPLSFCLPRDTVELEEYGERFGSRLTRHHRRSENGPPPSSTTPESCCTPTPGKQAQPIPSCDGALHLILKPDCSSRGVGIRLCLSVKDAVADEAGSTGSGQGYGSGSRHSRSAPEAAAPNGRTLAQAYLPRPLLLDGRKFDLRVYVLVTSVAPTLRVFVARAGLVRLSSMAYSTPSRDNIDDHRMFLTNTALNGEHAASVAGERGSCKWTLDSLFAALAASGVDTGALWTAICDLIAKTMLAARPTLAAQYRALRPCLRGGGCGINQHVATGPAARAVGALSRASVGGKHGAGGRAVSARGGPYATTTTAPSPPLSARARMTTSPPLIPPPQQKVLSTPSPSPAGEQGFRCFELLGVDILLDMSHCRCGERFQHIPGGGGGGGSRCQPRPVLLEVNQTPAMALDSDLDVGVKVAVTRDALVLSSLDREWLTAHFEAACSAATPSDGTPATTPSDGTPAATPSDGTPAATSATTFSSVECGSLPAGMGGRELAVAVGSAVPSPSAVDAARVAIAQRAADDFASLVAAQRHGELQRGGVDGGGGVRSAVPELWAEETWMVGQPRDMLGADATAVSGDGVTAVPTAVSPTPTAPTTTTRSGARYMEELDGPSQLCLALRRCFEDAHLGVYDRVLPPTDARTCARYRTIAALLPPCLLDAQKARQALRSANAKK